MKLAIMQPYFMPYLGYWQVMNLVDRYVVYDDVNYIKGGWINRNRILVNGAAQYINLLLSGASPNKKINEIELLGDARKTEKLLSTIEMCYAKAPCYKDAFPVIEGIIREKEKNLGRFLYLQHQRIADYLGLETKLILSSSMEKDNSLKGVDKVLSICRQLDANTYINSIGGRHLYTKEQFAQYGMDMFFLEMGDVRYQQFKNDFVPALSIIDVMMFNSRNEIKRMLGQYELI